MSERRVVLGLLVGAEPVQGWLQIDDGPRESFHGWLALSSRLERERAADGSVPTVAQTPAQAAGGSGGAGGSREAAEPYS